MSHPVPHEETETDSRPVGVADGAACRICGSKDGVWRQAAERMFGTGEVFTYFQCDRCGCLQISEVPGDLSPYYPDSYYSLNSAHETDPPPAPAWRTWLQRKRNELQLFPKSTPWHALASRRPSSQVNIVREWYQGCPVESLDARVLDVGCGSGQRLRSLSRIGFRDVVGIDPFMTPVAKESLPPGMDLQATTLDALQAPLFDVIMFHHSLEHMDGHATVFQNVARLMKPSGACLVRIPVSSSELLESHGDAWVEWDPPRHLYLHSAESLQRVVESAGLTITQTYYDSTEFCYWASDLYRNDVCLMDADTKRFRVPEEHFDAPALTAFSEQAQAANRRGTSSRAGFWIQHQA